MVNQESAIDVESGLLVRSSLLKDILSIIGATFLSFISVVSLGTLGIAVDVFFLVCAALLLIWISKLLGQGRTYFKLTMAFFAVLGFCLGTAVGMVAAGARGNNYTVSLYDSCEQLRFKYTCIWANPLSRVIVSARCLDPSFLWIERQDLKSGYTDLSQQCFGG